MDNWDFNNGILRAQKWTSKSPKLMKRMMEVNHISLGVDYYHAYLFDWCMSFFIKTREHEWSYIPSV